MVGCIPRNHSHLYFDKLIRTQKMESALSLIYASYGAAKVKGIRPSDIKDEVKIRLVSAFDLFRRNVTNDISGSGSYVGFDKQFASQYTLGLELAIWRNSDLMLNDLAIKVAEGRITIREYFDVFFSNYVQPINNINVHPVYSILQYMIKHNISSVPRNLISEVLEVGETSLEYINGLLNYLNGTNYFVFDKINKCLLYRNIRPKQYYLDRCDIKYIGAEGYKLFKSDIGEDREAYIDYVTKYNKVKD